MLVLEVKLEERVAVGTTWVQLIRVEKDRVKLAFDGPRDVIILREKMLKKARAFDQR